MELSTDNKEKAQVKEVLGPGANFNQLFDTVGDYVETRIELLKLDSTKKVSDLASDIAVHGIIAFIAIIFLIVLNIGVGYWLGELFGKIHYGFFALAGFYLFVGIIFLLAKNAIVKRPVANAVIKKIL